MRRPTIATAALLATFLTLITGGTASGRVAEESSAAATSEFDAAVLAEINRVRRAHDLRPLQPDDGLERAAAAHANSMASRGFFGHSSADGTSATTRIRRFYDGLLVAETLFWRSPRSTPRQTVQAWLESSAHRLIVLRSGFRELGLSALDVVNAPGVFGGMSITLVVADFGTG